jgi:hypothetical protein
VSYQTGGFDDVIVTYELTDKLATFILMRGKAQNQRLSGN